MLNAVQLWGTEQWNNLYVIKNSLIQIRRNKSRLNTILKKLVIPGIIWGMKHPILRNYFIILLWPRWLKLKLKQYLLPILRYVPNYRIHLKILNVHTNIVESRSKIVLKNKLSIWPQLWTSLCVCVFVGELCASFNKSEFKVWLLSSECITKTLVKKEVDNLMKNLEDLIKTKPELCVGSFSKSFRACMLWLLQIMLQWTWEHMFLHVLISFPLVMIPEKRFLDHMVFLFLVFE